MRIVPTILWLAVGGLLAGMRRSPDVPKIAATGAAGPAGFDAVIDRVATRLGAAAVLSVAAYPVAYAAYRLAEGYFIYDLPAIRAIGPALWLLITISVPMTALAFIATFLTIMPVVDYGTRERSLLRTLAAVGLTVVLILAFIITIALIAMDSLIADPMRDAAQQLDEMRPACGKSRLSGQECEDAINLRLQEKAAKAHERQPPKL